MKPNIVQNIEKSVDDYNDKLLNELNEKKREEKYEEKAKVLIDAFEKDIESLTPVIISKQENKNHETYTVKYTIDKSSCETKMFTAIINRLYTDYDSVQIKRKIELKLEELKYKYFKILQFDGTIVTCFDIEKEK